MTCKTFLTPQNFKFQVHKLPTFESYVQMVDFPGIQTGQTEGFKTPFQTINVPGEHMRFDDLKVTFKIDEDLDNYLEIFEWIEGIGRPTDSTGFAALVAAKGVQVDGNLIIMKTNTTPNLKFTFVDLYPINLSGFKLDYTVEGIEYITADVVFSYRQYTWERL